MLLSKRTWGRVGIFGLSGLVAITSCGAALAKKAPKDYSPLVFDATKLKKTPTRLTDRLSYSAYTSLRFQGEQNIQQAKGVHQ
jgi:hypothetical protein